MTAVIATPAPRRSALRRILRNPTAVTAGSVVMLVVLIAVCAPWLSPHDPQVIDLANRFAPPSVEHLLGADGSGRDVLSRLLYGAQPTLLAGLIAVVVAVAVGVPSGLIAGYYSRWFDSLASWSADALMTLPAIVVLLAVVPTLGNNLVITMVILGVFISPGLFRLTRNTVRGVRNELYVDAARVSGLSDWRIIFRHVLYVVRGPVIISVSLMVGVAIVVQAGLEFLGIGEPDAISWGSMLNSAFTTITLAPDLIYAPGLALGITAAACAVLGPAINDSLNDTRVRRSKRVRRPVDTIAVAPAQESPVVEVADADAAPVPATAAEGVVVEVRGLKVGYPSADKGVRDVVRGVDLRVARGEILGLVGESGSGKTQTSFGILGLLPPEAVVRSDVMRLGDLNLIGLRESKLRELRGPRMAYVPQEPMSNLDPTFTIGFQMVEVIRTHKRISKAGAQKQAESLLERVGIVDPAGTMRKYPHEISGGMAQRVLIAAAISCDPELLIADEPTTALDVTIQAEVLRLLRSLRDEFDLAIILVTHNLGVVADICDTVAVMKDGEIVEQGGVEDLFARPQHSYTRKLLGAVLSEEHVRDDYEGASIHV